MKTFELPVTGEALQDETANNAQRANALMAMKKSKPAPSPDAYVANLKGWQREVVEKLRQLVRSSGEFDEVIKWGHLVYFSNGPVLLIRAEESRVLFGFWRGKRLRDFDDRLKPGGKYELATITLTAESKISPSKVKKLVTAAIALNEDLGDPTGKA